MGTWKIEDVVRLALSVAAVLLAIVALLSLCRGMLLTPNSLIWGCTGTTLLLAVLTMCISESPAEPATQVRVAMPVAPAVAALFFAALRRLARHWKILCREERALRVAEALIYVVLLGATMSFIIKIGQVGAQQAGTDGRIVGIALCSIAVLQTRLCMLEAWRGSLEVRLFAEVASARAAAFDVEGIQIPMTPTRSFLSSHPDIDGNGNE